VIAIIPARGGSKRIPRKNIKPFLGVPIICHTINEIRSTELFSRIVVSTEDSEIAQVAQSAGAEVIVRSKSLADDFTTTIDVIADAILQLKNSVDLDNDIVGCIYPVTPMIKAEYFAVAYQLLAEGNLDYVFTAKEFESSPARSLRIGANGKTEMYSPENLNVRTQDLPKYYHDAALFYIGRAKAWAAKNPILTGDSKFITVGKYESVDVDDIEDWEYLELLYSIKKGRNKLQ
jgi:pseudaminic acid cytidylyltransferase